MNRKAARFFLILHLIAAAGALMFPVYVRISKLFTLLFPGCALHDFLFLYCPLCGGTRALSYMLHLNFPAAVRANAFVVFAAAVFFGYYIAAWVRLIKGKERLFVFRGWFWVAMVSLLLVFGILRNVLMICCGFDPLGDLVSVWN